MFSSNYKLYGWCKRLIKFLHFTLPFIIVLASCHLHDNKSNDIKFNPVLKKVYHFSLVKNTVKSWTYQSIPAKIYDTVYMNFSLQNLNKTDSSITCRVTWNRFTWKGKFKVNYMRDSPHALSTEVVMSDRGKVIYAQDMSGVLMDIDKDTNTGKYLAGVIPDQMGTRAITDMLNRIFSVIPDRDVKTNNTWVTDITLTTNHPVNISNFNVLKGINGDTATINIQSNFIARFSDGYDPYINGKQQGVAYVNFTTGIPFGYRTQSEIITSTDYYDVKQAEDFILRLQ